MKIKSPFKLKKGSNGTFGVGSAVILKKGKLPAVIRESQGPKTWRIELVDLQNGAPTGTFQDGMKSQQLRWPKDGEYPSNNNGNEEEEEDEDGRGDNNNNNNNNGNVEVLNDPPIDPRPRQVLVDLNALNNNDAVELSVIEDATTNSNHSSFRPNDNSFDIETDSVQPGANGGDSLSGSDKSADEDEDEPDPDDEDEEDIPTYENDMEMGGDASDANDFACIRGIEKDEEVHKAKYEKYLIEKQQLITQGWTVTKNPPRTQGIDVGIKVRERHGLKRQGVVTKDDREERGPPAWSVKFDGDAAATPGLPSSALKVVKDNRVFTWKTVSDVEPNNPVMDYNIHGVCGFDFQRKFEKTKFESADNEYDFPFLALLQHLWPGDWRQHLRNLNNHIANENERTRRPVKVVSEKEFWVFWGVIFAACPCKKGGEKLFGSKKEPFRCAPVIDVTLDADGRTVMTWDRFKKIKESIPYAFYDGANTDDPWHPLTALIDGFNDKRQQYVATSIIVVLDESMSNFQPRTTKTSLLPFLSFIFRKPKPLGTEYKDAACKVLRMLSFLEIQRGKNPMRLMKFGPDVGATAACSLRLIIGASYCGLASRTRRTACAEEKRLLVFADSWFGSVKLAESMKLLWREEKPGGKYEYNIDRDRGENPNAHEGVFAVKSNHAFFPKKELERKMRKWPGGSYLVMETKCPGSDITLYAIGYKYNAKKVLCFVMTENAGSTAPGLNPYIARFPDKHRNICKRAIPRPEIISKYFGGSNVIDSHNHSRQHLLGLEKYWNTKNPWFRNDCTIIGMTATDCLHAVQYHVPHFKNMSVEEYADRTAYDCINNPFNSSAENPRGYIECDGLNDNGLQARHQAGAMPNFVFGNTEGSNQATLSCCDDGVSPLSFNSSSLGATFGFPTNGEHDVRKQRVIGHDNRGVKRKCWICGKDTRWECDNKVCMKRIYQDKDELYSGVPLCNPNAGARTHTLKYGSSNTLTCLQLHRQELRSGAASNTRYRR